MKILRSYFQNYLVFAGDRRRRIRMGWLRRIQKAHVGLKKGTNSNDDNNNNNDNNPFPLISLTARALWHLPKKIEFHHCIEFRMIAFAICLNGLFRAEKDLRFWNDFFSPDRILEHLVLENSISNTYEKRKKSIL